MPLKKPRVDLITIDLRRMGRVLKCARENLRFSYRELAAKSGVSATQLLRIESGEFEYSSAKLFRVCLALGVPIGPLFEYSTDRTLIFAGKFAMDSRSRKMLEDLRLDTKDIEKRFFDLVNNCYCVAMGILTASDPVSIAMGVDYPFPSMIEKYGEFASSVRDFSNIERLATMESLDDKTLEKLKSLGLLKHDQVIEFIKNDIQWDLNIREPDEITRIIKNANRI